MDAARPRFSCASDSNSRKPVYTIDGRLRAPVNQLSEHDRIVLVTDLPGEKLAAGDVGTVVHIHGQGRAVEHREITHARRVA